MMFLTLLKKEIQDYLISIRFVVLLALCVLLIPLSLYVNFETYRRWATDYNEQEKSETVKGSRGRPAFAGLRPPSALSVFANGIETSLAKDFSIQSPRIIFGTGRSYGDPIYETFGRIDFLFVVQAVLSLIAFLFAFDAVSGEKEMGTLKLAMANPVPRYKILLAKFAGGMIVLVAPFLLSFAIGSTILVVAGYPLFQGTILAKVALILLLSMIYIIVFFVMGLFVSTLTHQSKTALIVLMFVWVVLVLGVPRLSMMAAKVIRPVEDDAVVALRIKLLTESIQNEKGNALKQLYFDKAREKNLSPGLLTFDSSDPAFVKKRNEIAGPFEARMREELAKIDADQQRRRQAQLNLARNIARISPASLLSYLMTDITDSGEHVKVKFLTAVRLYSADLDRVVFSKIYSDSISDGDRSWGFSGNFPGQETPKDPPRFSFSFPRTAESLAHSIVDIGLLLACAVALFAAASVAFIRYDVR
jgi:ABC-type transport system involved in multi-copper enzyme maturation permease subunit